MLVMGVYDSIDAARAARGQLPDRVKASEPWIRRIDELQEVIRTTTPVDRLVATQSGYAALSLPR